MSQLRDLLDREAHRVDAHPDALGSVLGIRDRRQRHRRAGAIALVGLLLAIATAWAAGAVRTESSIPVGQPSDRSSTASATPTPTATPDPSAILDGVEVDVTAPGVTPLRTPKEIARTALRAIGRYEERVGGALAPRRLVSITLVAPGVIYGSVSQDRAWWGVRFEGTIVMWGGSSAPADFGYTRGSFGIDDASGRIQTQGVDGPGCLVARGEPPPGFEDTPDCTVPDA